VGSLQTTFLAPSPSVTEDRPKSIGTNLKSSPAFLIRGILRGGGQASAQTLKSTQDHGTARSSPWVLSSYEVSS